MGTLYYIIYAISIDSFLFFFQVILQAGETIDVGRWVDSTVSEKRSYGESHSQQAVTIGHQVSDIFLTQ